MRSVPLATLENAIARPGFERHLVPLLHFKGHTDLGAYHRRWNLLVSMHEHECETIGEGLYHLALNPQFAQLCLPPKPTDNLAMKGFLSRLQAKPHVANDRPGLLDYARMLMPRPFNLISVSEAASRNRHAWWRSFESRMPAWRAIQASRKAERAELRLREGEARRAGRLAQRDAIRAERLALVLLAREARRKAKDARQAARDKAAREPKAFVLRESSAAPIAYPFLIHDGGRPEHDLLRAINNAVPRGIMGDLRADICQDLAVGVLCGDFSRADLLLPAKEMIRRIKKMFPDKYGPLSLDAIIPGTDGLRLIDTI